MYLYCEYLFCFYQDLIREIIIEDEKGKKMEVLKVFFFFIGYFKERLLIKCKMQMIGIDDFDIMWVLIVLVIWDDKLR